MMKNRQDIDEALAAHGQVSFNPKLVYLGAAMVALLIANAFLANQKGRLQTELDARDEQILRLQTELMALQASTEPSGDEVSELLP